MMFANHNTHFKFKKIQEIPLGFTIYFLFLKSVMETSTKMMNTIFTCTKKNIEISRHVQFQGQRLLVTTSNNIDNHNRVRQAVLKLEKSVFTNKCWLRIWAAVFVGWKGD